MGMTRCVCVCVCVCEGRGLVGVSPESANVSSIMPIVVQIKHVSTYTSLKCITLLPQVPHDQREPCTPCTDRPQCSKV